MKTILIVEDDTAMQKIYQTTLSKAGYQTLQALTTDEGAAQAQKHPNLILLDIMLPGNKNGFDLLEALKKDEKLKNIPVIILTNLESEKKTALEIGAVDYLIKANISLEDLVACVKKQIGA